MTSNKDSTAKYQEHNTAKSRKIWPLPWKNDKKQQGVQYDGHGGL